MGNLTYRSCCEPSASEERTNKSAEALETDSRRRKKMNKKPLHLLGSHLVAMAPVDEGEGGRALQLCE
jgi:hypothetical protein